MDSDCWDAPRKTTPPPFLFKYLFPDKNAPWWAGNVLYCPGAMLDVSGVALALARECANVDTLLCVSAFEVSTLASQFQVKPRGKC